MEQSPSTLASVSSTNGVSKQGYDRTGAEMTVSQILSGSHCSSQNAHSIKSTGEGDEQCQQSCG